MSDFSTVGPVNLHISHSWGGGLGKWVRDFAHADRASTNLVLECVGTKDCYGVGHRLADACSGKEIEYWTLADPIAEVRPAHPLYRKNLENIVDRHDVEHIYVSSLTGHTLEVMDLGVPVTRIHHDFFPWCPALYCYRDGTCSSCTESDLELCRRSHFRQPMNEPGFYEGFRKSLHEAYGRAEVRHVAPNVSVRRQLCSIDQRFRALDFRIIEHGIDCAKADLFGGAPDGDRLRVGIFGPMGWQKGSRVLRSEFDRLRLLADFVLFGSGEATAEYEHRFGVKTVTFYENSDLEGCLRKHPIDIALFLSVVPESFSYTLSEVWAFGIPPLAHRIGALAERITPNETGFLFALENDGLMDELLRLDNDRQSIRSVARRCAGLRVRSTAEMVRDYYDLRADEPSSNTKRAESAQAKERSGLVV